MLMFIYMCYIILYSGTWYLTRIAKHTLLQYVIIGVYAVFTRQKQSGSPVLYNIYNTREDYTALYSKFLRLPSDNPRSYSYS